MTNDRPITTPFEPNPTKKALERIKNVPDEQEITVIVNGIPSPMTAGTFRRMLKVFPLEMGEM
jgi:hypothetical protein